MTGLIAIDFETHLISQEMPIPKPVCLSYYKDGGQNGIVTGRDGMEAFLNLILSSDDKIIAHNMSFEANVIDTWFPKLRFLLRDKFKKNQMICTKVYQQLLSNVSEKQTFKFDLASLVSQYFNEDISADKKDPDSWRLRYSELEDVKLENWPEEAKQYALDDSVWAFKLYIEQRKTYMDISLSVKADYYLNKMGAFGIACDQERVLKLKQELLDILNPKYERLIKLGLCSRDKKGKAKKKMKLFREYLEKNIKELEYTAKGCISTSTESLERYGKDPVIQDFLDIAKYEKILTAFISRLEGADVVRTQYNAVVSTGRTSSRTSPNYHSVNIQQMPRTVEGVSYDIRNCFKARPGYQIVSIDYNGLELASTAHQLSMVTGLDNMKRLVNSGSEPIDMHSMFACKLKSIKDKRDVKYEEFVANKKKPGYKEYRQLAKPINLGFPGGIGYDTMRSLLIRDGVYPELLVLAKSKYEENLNYQVTHFRKKGYPVRVRRTGPEEFQLVKDELVSVKDQMFKLYPDLQMFLMGEKGIFDYKSFEDKPATHFKYLTGKSKMVKNDYGEWEKEPMYSYSVANFKRDWCMYTQICNGYLMQSPAALGAKKALCSIIEKYAESKTCNPLAFIHDECLMEVKIGYENSIIEDVSKILIEEMQTVLYSVRIAVEADVCGEHWSKEGDGSFCVTYWKDPKGDKIYAK